MLDERAARLAEHYKAEAGAWRRMAYVGMAVSVLEFCLLWVRYLNA
jgi:hypothetical protein